LHDTVIEFNFTDKLLMSLRTAAAIFAYTARVLPVAVFVVLVISAVPAIAAVWRRARSARCRLR
jgi:hypothetical protein